MWGGGRGLPVGVIGWLVTMATEVMEADGVPIGR